MAGIKNSAQCNTCHENPKLVKRKRRFEQCEDCRRESIKNRLAARRVRRTFHEGNCLVQYYGDGWRVGYLLKIGTSLASVQPLGGIGGAVPDILSVALEDIKPEFIRAGSMPATVEGYYTMMEKKKVVVLVADRKATEYPPMSEAERAVLTPALVERPKNAVVTQAASPVTPIAAVKTVVSVPEKSTATRMRHAPVDLTEARRLFENGMAVNDIVEAVKGTRNAFDVKKLIRKTFKTLGILKD